MFPHRAFRSALFVAFVAVSGRHILTTPCSDTGASVILMVSQVGATGGEHVTNGTYDE